MAKIFYSMAGEGRGHAVRVRTLVEILRHRHELTLFAPDDAYEFLARFYAPSVGCQGVRLIKIPGLRFHYTSGQLDLWRSIAAGFEYAWNDLGALTRDFVDRIELDQPDLAIADFEPALPRAARLAGLPWLSLDHQHVLLAYDLSALPADLQRYAWLMSHAVRWYAPGPIETVASAFYTPPLKPGFEYVRQIGPLIRPDLETVSVYDSGHLVSYLRPNSPPAAIEVLAKSPLPVKLYGLGEQPPVGAVTFHPLSEQTFVRDVAESSGLVAAAGNQLLGEATFLGKPVLAIPEANHHEQLINAHFLKQMGQGEWTTLEQFSIENLNQFVDRLAEYRRPVRFGDPLANGTAAAVDHIESILERSGLALAN